VKLETNTGSFLSVKNTRRSRREICSCCRIKTSGRDACRPSLHKSRNATRHTESETAD